MSILKRIGTQGVKLLFHIHLHYISLPLPKLTKIKISWKRRNKLSETSEFLIDSTRIIIDQTLSMQNTVYQKSTGYLTKEAELKVLAEFSGGWKEIARAVINISEFIDIPAKELQVALAKCQERDATICVSIKTDSGLREEMKSVETSSDELIRQLNDTKNKLFLLKNELDEAESCRRSVMNEVEAVREEVEAIRKGEVCSTVVKLREENYEIKKCLDECKSELDVIKEKNESLRNYIKRNEAILAKDAFNKINEEKHEAPLEDQAANLGSRLNDIMRKFSVMPK